MQLRDNDVKPESLRPLSYLVFPFHSLTGQDTKVRANVRVVVRGAAPASWFISHVQWTCHQRRLGFLKGPQTGWFWSSEGRMVCSWILKQFSLCVSLLLPLSVCQCVLCLFLKDYSMLLTEECFIIPATNEPPLCYSGHFRQSLIFPYSAPGCSSAPELQCTLFLIG